RDIAALEGGAEDEALADRQVEPGRLHVRAPAIARSGADKGPVAELILGVERGARVAAGVGDALAPAGGDRRRDAIVAILRQGEGAVENAPGAELALERQ